MRNSIVRLHIPALLVSGSLVGLALSNGGCSAVKDAASNIEQASSGCDELNEGASSISKLSIDGDTKAFVTASANLVSVATSTELEVLDACKAIDKDLKCTDTWSSLAPDAGAPDAETQAACQAAADKIKAILTADGGAGCQLVISGGHCTVDVDAQASCESTCTGMTSCTPGDITTECTPAEVTGECDGDCKANATCEGTVQTEAQCEGACQGECEGMCDSTACHGTHCAGMCQGKCSGDCKLAADAQASCGANVNCRGGCTVAYKAPKCETTVTPPACKSSETCKASCTSNVEATSKCTPPGVSLDCGADVSADVQAVIDTVKANLPRIVLFVQSQSKIVLDAANQVVATGKIVANDVTTLGGKEIACAGAAVKADATASVSLQASFSASGSVSGSCGGPSAN
jgi:hypothetical protein